MGAPQISPLTLQADADLVAAWQATEKTAKGEECRVCQFICNAS